MCLTAIYLLIAWLAPGISVDYYILGATVLLDVLGMISILYIVNKEKRRELDLINKWFSPSNK